MTEEERYIFAISSPTDRIPTSEYLTEEAQRSRLMALMKRVASDAQAMGLGYHTFPSSSDFWKLPHEMQLAILNYLWKGMYHD